MWQFDKKVTKYFISFWREKNMNQNDRMKWWNEARFGMFIHWGLYSILGRDCWVMHHERIPKEEYAKLADRFCPPKEFTPELWVRLAKEAGMRYMVLTTRHHDGFCLFDSRVSDFTSVKTKAKRDFVAEYVDACRKFGMRIGFYYSLLDWRFPAYFAGPEKDPEGFEQMVEQAHSQIKELMTNYGKIDYLFYDGEWIPNVPFNRDLIKQEESTEVAKYWRSKQLNEMVRNLQSQIIINNRSGLAEDVDTPERFTVPSEENRAWESCMTIGDNWGYVNREPAIKSTAQLIQNLVICAGGGGNLLLNVGPDPDGSIRPEFAERLRQIGRWLEKNGDSIYGSERTPRGFAAHMAGMWWAPSGLATTKGNTVYIHVFHWPDNGDIIITGIKNNVLKARILANQQEVRVEKIGNGKIRLSGLLKEPPDPYDSVIALDLDGKPKVLDYAGIPL